jgi:hypothetical protein
MCSDETVPGDEHRRRGSRVALAIGYLVLQGLAGACWWIGLAFWPSVRRTFLPDGAPDWPLLSLWIADIMLFVVGSWVCAVCLYQQSRWVAPALWFTSGALAYAALYCLGTSLATGDVWLSTGLMCPAALSTLVISVSNGRDQIQ